MMKSLEYAEHAFRVISVNGVVRILTGISPVISFAGSS